MDVRRLFSLSCPLAHKRCLLRESLKRRIATVSAETRPGCRPRTLQRSTPQEPSIHEHHRQPSRVFQPPARLNEFNQIGSRISHQEHGHEGTHRAFSTCRRSGFQIHHRPRSIHDRNNTLVAQESPLSTMPFSSFSQHRCHHQYCRVAHKQPVNTNASTIVASGTKSFANTSKRQRYAQTHYFSGATSASYHSSPASHFPLTKPSSSAVHTPPSISSSSATHMPPTTNSSNLNPNASISLLFGRRRRRRAALHRFRHRRQMMFQQRSVPQHASQLQQMSVSLRRSRPASVNAASRQKRILLKKRKKRRVLPQLIQDESQISPQRLQPSPRTLPSSLPAPSNQYQHVHYYNPKRYHKRIRFLGFKHFLRSQRVNSWRGRQAYRMEKARLMHPLRLKADKQKYSLKREIVREHRDTLQEVIKNLAKGKEKKAIRSARLLISLRPQGVKLPNGNQFFQLASIDQVFYERFACASATAQVANPATDSMDQGTLTATSSTTVHENRPPYRRRVKKSYFTTSDYNIMLSHCEELGDWPGGYKIGRILLDRYTSPTYDFQSGNPQAAIPNVRTIRLLSTIFSKSNHPESAMELFATIHQGMGCRPYQKAIPEGVYSSFLSHLAASPMQLPRMNKLIEDLETYGPKPTTTMYNMLLKATGYQIGVDSAEDLLPLMRSKGCMPDQQTFQTLISVSLKDLDLTRAYFWLDQMEGQNIAIRARMLEPFMATCIRQVVSSLNKARFNRSASSASSAISDEYPQPNIKPSRRKINLAAIPAEDLAYSQEWMYSALQVIRLTKSKGLVPSLDMHEQLIQGFLAQDNLREARKMLHMMRDVYYYPITQRVWIKFFDYHLMKFDHESAMKILNEMRAAAKSRPVINEYLNVPRPEAVPTRLYHTLFRHLLDHGRLSNAERSLYEMLVRQRRARPSEKEVVDLIWKLERHPYAAERVYELLYSQTVAERVAVADSTTPMNRTNRILEQGPIQMANVGVMHAKALAKDASLQEDVWKDWGLMTHGFAISSQKDDDNTTGAAMDEEARLSQAKSHKAQVEKEMAVMAVAFEQVAMACRNMSPDSKRSLGSKQSGKGGDPNGKKEQMREPGPWDFLQTSSRERKRTQEAPKLGFVSLGLGTPGSFPGRRGDREEASGSMKPGLSFGRDFASENLLDQSTSTEGTRQSLMAGMTPGMHLAFTGKNRNTIQQLLRRNEFLQPLLDRRASLTETSGDLQSSSSKRIQDASLASASTKKGLASASLLDPMGAMTDRLERLRKSFEWLEHHWIPIRTSTLNSYLHSLVSYGDSYSIHEVVQSYVLGAKSNAYKGDTQIAQSTLESTLGNVKADLRTLRILNKWVSNLTTDSATTTQNDRTPSVSRHSTVSTTVSSSAWNERKEQRQEFKHHRDAVLLMEQVIQHVEPELQRSWKDQQSMSAAGHSNKT